MRTIESPPTDASLSVRRRGALPLAGALFASALAFQAVLSIAATIVACDVTVYAADDDPNGLDLRSGPGVAHAGVAVVRHDDVQFDIVGADGAWLRVARMRGVEGDAPSGALRGEAWVFGGLTAVRATRRQELRVAPDARGAVAGTMAADAPGRVEGCEGDWVRVQSGGVEEWMAPGLHCGNPVSGCV